MARAVSTPHAGDRSEKYTLFTHVAFGGACETAQEKHEKELGGVEISVSGSACRLVAWEGCKCVKSLSNFRRGAHVSRCRCANCTRVAHILEHCLLKMHSSVEFSELVNRKWRKRGAHLQIIPLKNIWGRQFVLTIPSCKSTQFHVF